VVNKLDFNIHYFCVHYLGIIKNTVILTKDHPSYALYINAGFKEGSRVLDHNQIPLESYTIQDYNRFSRDKLERVA
jgi:hypothetical protein